MANGSLESYRAIALEFTRALTAGEYERALGMTARQYRGRMTADGLKSEFEALVPPDWGETEPVEVGEIMADWPGRAPGDVGWVYVSIYGDVYSEGLVLIIAVEDGELRVRDIEFGRP